MAFPSSSFDFPLGSIFGMNRLAPLVKKVGEERIAAEGKLFKLGTVHFICVSNDNSEEERSFSKGVNIKFGSEKDSKEFCDSFEEWRKDALVPGSSTVSASNSKFDDKIEASSAKMYFHYYGQLLHQQIKYGMPLYVLRTICFVLATTNCYGVDLTPLFGSAHQGYFSQVHVFSHQQILVCNCLWLMHLIRGYCLNLFSQEEDFYEMDIPLKFTASMCTRVHGLACWFHVLFDESTVQRWLTTAPGAPTTHWYQPTKSARTHVIHGSPQLHSLHGLLGVAGTTFHLPNVSLDGTQ
ncbi:hypothetical protein HID58_056578 [Brassica napus]|uniref:type I protein arginine methyltransferase n=1 Tax=Brassica napus TaxID=3708 RepID=A0ABQ8ANL4_BRANA|nr:hypothetical protein HID58_056578 [Brassica napus]